MDQLTYHGLIILSLLVLCGCAWYIYHLMNRKENDEYDEWLAGYQEAFNDVRFHCRTYALLEFWKLEKQMPADAPYLKGYREALLDKGILR